jgi:hypothetical protein
MDYVQVDGVDSEPLEAPLYLVLRVATAGMEFRGDEDVLPR